MPDWVTGNHVLITSTFGWRMVGAQTSNRRGLFLTDEFISNPETFMIQPGVLRGFNMYVGANDSSTDVDIKFRKQVYNGVAGYGSTILFTLFTIPANTTGDFCAPKITSDLSNRSWARWDLCGITQTRLEDVGNGGITKITVGSCYEITEEEALDTGQPPNRPIIG